MGRPRKEETEQVEEVVKPVEVKKEIPKAEPKVKLPYWKTRGK